MATARCSAVCTAGRERVEEKEDKAAEVRGNATGTERERENGMGGSYVVSWLAAMDGRGWLARQTGLRRGPAATDT